MFCTACGTQMITGTRFCRRCGAPWIDSISVAAPSQDAASEPLEPAPVVKLSNKSRLLLFGTLLAVAIALGALAELSRRYRSGTANSPANVVRAENAGSKPAGGTITAAKVAKPVAPPRMAYVPGGEFLMGSDSGSEAERPAHKVAVKPFFIDLYEVTCEEYKKFIDATGHRAPPCWVKRDYPRGWAGRPVTGVDWDDASAYAAWAGKRLPTEQEWEFAARGGDGRRYPWGNQWKANAANADSTSHKHADNVGKHRAGASPFGLLDMAGNAWEWTASDYTDYRTGGLPPGAGDQKVIRGGSWAEDRQKATTTFRQALPARGTPPYGNLSFRCAKDVVTPESE
jgi:formylglycine-generating enzyme required for sulfatase activity